MRIRNPGSEPMSVVQAFLICLLEERPLPIPKLQKMEELYKLSESQNTEIVFRWIRIGIAARYRSKERVARGDYFGRRKDEKKRIAKFLIFSNSAAIGRGIIY
jgi:hypothetical protein